MFCLVAYYPRIDVLANTVARVINQWAIHDQIPSRRLLLKRQALQIVEVDVAPQKGEVLVRLSCRAVVCATGRCIYRR